MRYLRLLSIFYRNSLYTEMEYRANFVANLFTSAFWLAFAIMGLHVFFYHRDQIGAWGYYEAMLVVGFYSLFNGFIEALLRPNMSRIIEQIRTGTFEFVLIKPVNINCSKPGFVQHLLCQFFAPHGPQPGAALGQGDGHAMHG